MKLFLDPTQTQPEFPHPQTPLGLWLSEWVHYIQTAFTDLDILYNENDSIGIFAYMESLFQSMLNSPIWAMDVDPNKEEGDLKDVMQARFLSFYLLGAHKALNKVYGPMLANYLPEKEEMDTGARFAKYSVYVYQNLGSPAKNIPQLWQQMVSYYEQYDIISALSTHPSDFTHEETRTEQGTSGRI